MHTSAHSAVRSTKSRPKNLNLLSVRFPLSAIMSVGHRAAGMLLFLALPWFLYLLQLSLSGESGFLQVKNDLNSIWLKLIILVFIWALAHHFIAGIRYFLLDLDIGIERQTAQKSALLVMILGVLLTAIAAFFLF